MVTVFLNGICVLFLDIYRAAYMPRPIFSTRWIAMTFCTDIRGPQQMNPTDFGRLLTFPQTPPAG